MHLISYKWHCVIILKFLLTVPGPVEGDKVITRIELGSDVGVTFMFPVQFVVYSAPIVLLIVCIVVKILSTHFA